MRNLTEHKLMLGLGHFYAVRPLIDMDIPMEPGCVENFFFTLYQYGGNRSVDRRLKNCFGLIDL